MSNVWKSAKPGLSGMVYEWVTATKSDTVDDPAGVGVGIRNNGNSTIAVSVVHDSGNVMVYNLSPRSELAMSVRRVNATGTVPALADVQIAAV